MKTAGTMTMTKQRIVGVNNYWSRRNELSARAERHTAEMQKKYADKIAECVGRSKIYGGDHHSPKSFRFNGSRTSVTSLCKNTTTEALFLPSLANKNVTLLNFASYNNPGGAFLDGSSAQEESLCHTSFLYNVLSRMPEYYYFNNKRKNKALYTDRAIFTPDVLFFDPAGQNDPNARTRTANVITCAAPNRSVLEKYGSFTEEMNLNALRQRVEFIRDICFENRCEAVILGAWGCGVFRQDARIVANMFMKAFENMPITVVYAVPDAPTYQVFAECLSYYER